LHDGVGDEMTGCELSGNVECARRRLVILEVGAVVS